MVAHPEGAPPWSEGPSSDGGYWSSALMGWTFQVSVDGLVQLKLLESSCFDVLEDLEPPLCFLKTQRISRNFPWKVPRGSNDSWNRILAWDDGDRWGFDPFTPGSAAISEARSWEIGPKKWCPMEFLMVYQNISESSKSK